MNRLVHFEPYLREVSHREFFPCRLGRIQAAVRRNLLSDSAEGCMNNTLHLESFRLKKTLKIVGTTCKK